MPNSIIWLFILRVQLRNEFNEPIFNVKSENKLSELPEKFEGLLRLNFKPEHLSFLEVTSKS